MAELADWTQFRKLLFEFESAGEDFICENNSRDSRGDETPNIAGYERLGECRIAVLDAYQAAFSAIEDLSDRLVCELGKDEPLVPAEEVYARLVKDGILSAKWVSTHMATNQAVADGHVYGPTKLS